MKGGYGRAILVEIVAALLVLTLAGAALAQLFAAAHRQTQRAELLSFALSRAQDAAQEAYCSYALEPREWSEGGCSFYLGVRSEKTESGEMRYAWVEVTDEAGERIVSLPCSRYIPDVGVRP